MGYKDSDTCLKKAAADEPIFVLRAKDLLAPNIVREWADRAVAAGTPPEKVAEARELARKMDAWAERHGGKVPD